MATIYDREEDAVLRAIILGDGWKAEKVWGGLCGWVVKWRVHKKIGEHNYLYDEGGSMMTDDQETLKQLDSAIDALGERMKKAQSSEEREKLRKDIELAAELTAMIMRRQKKGEE